MFEWMSCHTKNFVRDKSALFFSLIFPIVLVVLLGNMLAELDNPDTPVGTIGIAYSIETTEPYETQAARAFVDSLAGNGGIALAEARDAGEARADAASGAADAAIIFESPLRIRIAEGGDLYKNRAVTMIAQGFAREYASFAAIASLAPERLEGLAAAGLREDGLALIADKDLGVTRSMMDYYAVTMVVMIAFMGGGIGGASSTYFSRQDGSLRRVTASPRGRARLFLESVVGVLPQNILQVLIVMVPSALFLGAHYARAWQENLLLFAFFILLGTAVSAVFMLVGLFIRVNPFTPLMALLWCLLFLSGSFSKDIHIEGFSEYLPMSIAQRAAFDLTVFGRPGQLLLVMAACAAILAASCAIGSLVFRKKEVMF
ncbi:MAG: ABC transporter permease [Clostridiales Family XIII bacterium]|jgi:ABC-2 type transport system permease protein|nr:ABC transporter permease [Clostridiales Family XIII bacterium]